MTGPNKTSPQQDAVAKPKWRYWVGLAIFVISYPIFYGTLFVAPFLALSVSQTTALISLAAAISYGLWLLSLPLLGQEIFDARKKRYAVWRRFWRLQRGRDNNDLG